MSFVSCFGQNVKCNNIKHLFLFSAFFLVVLMGPIDFSRIVFSFYLCLAVYGAGGDSGGVGSVLHFVCGGIGVLP